MSTEVISEEELQRRLADDFQHNMANEAIPRLHGIRMMSFPGDKESWKAFVAKNLSAMLEGTGDIIRQRLGIIEDDTNIDVGKVYFVQAGTEGSIKIGFTRNLKRRIAALQTSHVERLNLLGVIEPATMKTERETHLRFCAYRTGGEWFSPCEELLRFIESETQLVGIEGRTLCVVMASKLKHIAALFNKAAKENVAAVDFRFGLLNAASSLIAYAERFGDAEGVRQLGEAAKTVFPESN